MRALYISNVFLSDTLNKASAYNAGDPGSIPGSGRSLGKGNRNPSQYTCLGNPMDREPGRLESMALQNPDMT